MTAPFLTSVRREADLGRYLTEIRRFPMLAPEQEVSLARRWRDQRDLAATHTLMTSHLRLVAKMAMGYGGYGLPLNDLIAEGNIGLMQAVTRFDPERGFRLATYAMWWIRAAIQQYILHNWSLVKMGTTAAQKKLFFNLRRIKARMQAIDEGDLPTETVRKIATELDVPEADVVDMNRRLAGLDHSLNASPSPNGEGEWQDWVADEIDDQEARLAQREEFGLRRKMLNCAIRRLSERERDIVSERHLRDEPATLEVLSRRYNISRERVRQIEVRALGKLRDAMHRLASTRVGSLTVGARAVA